MQTNGCCDEYGCVRHQPVILIIILMFYERGLTRFFIALLELLIILVDFGRSCAVGLYVVIQVPAEVFIRDSKH